MIEENRVMEIEQYPSVPIKYSQRSSKNSIKNNESVTFNEFVSE